MQRENDCSVTVQRALEIWGFHTLTNKRVSDDAKRKRLIEFEPLR